MRIEERTPMACCWVGNDVPTSFAVAGDFGRRRRQRPAIAGFPPCLGSVRFSGWPFFFTANFCFRRRIGVGKGGPRLKTIGGDNLRSVDGDEQALLKGRAMAYADKRRRAELARRAVSHPTEGGRKTDRLLLALAERLERETDAAPAPTTAEDGGRCASPSASAPKSE
jgi:hypothetical protein